MEGGVNLFATFLPPPSSIKKLDVEVEQAPTFVRAGPISFSHSSPAPAPQHPGIIEPIPWLLDAPIRLRPEAETYNGPINNVMVSSPMGSEHQSTVTTQSLSPHVNHKPLFQPVSYPSGCVIPEHQALTRFPEQAGGSFSQPLPTGGMMAWQQQGLPQVMPSSPLAPLASAASYPQPPAPVPPLRTWSGPLYQQQLPPTIVESNFDHLRVHVGPPPQHAFGPPAVEEMPRMWQPEDRASPDETSPRSAKRPRLIWTDELHRRFIEAVDATGGLDKALPKAIMKEMGVPGLTRENVASHLQKYRLRVKARRLRQNQHG